MDFWSSSDNLLSLSAEIYQKVDLERAGMNRSPGDDKTSFPLIMPEFRCISLNVLIMT